MWKILTAPIKEGIYNSLINLKMFLEEQKECFKSTRRTGGILYTLINISSRRRKRDEKIFHWRGLTTKRHKEWFGKAGQ